MYGTDGGESSIYSPAVYQYVYDGQGNIIQSIDITNGKCYNYEYEEGRIIRATESDITLSGEIVTAKAVVNTIRYDYDAEGQLTKKVITPTSGSGQTIYYETGDENTVVKFTAGGRTVTSHSKTDSFGRKTFDELQLGTDFVSRQFVYHAGKVTQEHKDKEKVKSSATTQLVSQIILSNGTTLFYNYDAEERITSVMESCMVDGVPVTNTTRYTYDALGQLLTETVNGLVVNSMEYDNYGNIVKKNGKVYTYGDAAWKDLLTSYNGQAITYDAQGNPTEYLGHTLTWEKGRQLKKFVKSDGAVIDYAYNANGIRTSKTVDGIRHDYVLDGAKILRETWNGNTLIPMYDNEDSVCGIQYNDVPYYFIKNLQGDVIAIVNKDAQTVAKYTYDAWGVCTITQDTTDCNIAAINPYRYRGYYFDAEIGMYYLQSRYYDAGVGRFVNGDDATYIQSVEKTILHCLFTYCENDCANKTDEMGFASLRVVGYGFQIEMSVGWCTFGVELVWYIVSSIRQGRAWYIPFVYLYGGGGLSSDLTSMISKITKNPNLLFNPKNITQASASISIFAIFGYTGKFNKPQDYEGWFSGTSVTIWNVKAYTAWCSTCFVVGAGVSTSKFSASAGATYYRLSSNIFTSMSNVYNTVSNKGKTLKR